MRRTLLTANGVVACLAASKLLIHLYAGRHYGYFVDQPRIETHHLGPLAQIFADQFGWDEVAATVAGAYNALPAGVRAKTAIFGQNYGQAVAIDFFGRKYGLPPAISGHQSYFLWEPRGYTGESMIVMAGREGDLESRFASVRKVAHVSHPYSMP